VKLVGFCLGSSLGLIACTAQGSKEKVSLTAAIDVPANQTDPRSFDIKLRIANTSSRATDIIPIWEFPVQR
jgi:hypothetical protein